MVIKQEGIFKENIIIKNILNGNKLKIKKKRKQKKKEI